MAHVYNHSMWTYFTCCLVYLLFLAPPSSGHRLRCFLSASQRIDLCHHQDQAGCWTRQDFAKNDTHHVQIFWKISSIPKIKSNLKIASDLDGDMGMKKSTLVILSLDGSMDCLSTRIFGFPTVFHPSLPPPIPDPGGPLDPDILRKYTFMASILTLYRIWTFSKHKECNFSNEESSLHDYQKK